jgi:hypothetical protein
MEQILGTPPPPPPPNVPKLIDDQGKVLTGTLRQRMEQHRKDPGCASCHSRMDPLGFGLENFDGAGLWRTMDHGKPVDAAGELAGTDVDGKFSGVVELAKRLSGSQQVQDCVATQWFRFGYGRQEEDADACTLGTLRDAFAKSGGNVRDLLVALTQTDAFMFRSPAEAQSSQTGTTGAKP